MEYFKLQFGCLLILMYISFVYIRECKQYNKHKPVIFDALLVISLIEVIFDCVTAYTVNNLDKINPTVNMLCHLVFLLGIDSFIFLTFIYIVKQTMGLPVKTSTRMFIISPFVLNVITVILFIPKLEYRVGNISNYSMGISAYTCFVMAGLYILLTLGVFLSRWKYVESHKRFSTFTFIIMMICVTSYQMFKPQSLVSSICVTIIIVGLYMNIENPVIKELSYYHSEMVMGFATLVENKDGSTGGHIKRTSLYVELIVNELRRKGHYKNLLTKDYMNNLKKAAPMHDIGKIAIPDVILQKPGKLTDQEYDKMKEHSAKGGEIILKTLGHLNDKAFTDMAYQVARYHHEKWNGLGYPEGIKEDDIPLCARIMAVADVFDAISMKRCYRDPLPLEKCFSIIKEGRGTDFDPLIVDIFLDIRQDVEKIYNEVYSD